MSTQCPDRGAYLPRPGTSYISNGNGGHKQGCRNSAAQVEWRNGKQFVPRKESIFKPKIRLLT